MPNADSRIVECRLSIGVDWCRLLLQSAIGNRQSAIAIRNRQSQSAMVNRGNLQSSIFSLK